jgi:SAM-dependent methyltransferase
MTTAPDVSTPAGLMRLGNAFCDAKALLTAVDLDLFTHLQDGPATPEEIRQRLQLHGRGLLDFLHLLTALGVLVKDGDRFGNAPGAQGYLVRGKPSYVGGFMHRANRNLYPAWGKLDEALRTGRPQSGGRFEEVLARPEVLRQFIGMMDALTQQLAPELVDAYDWGQHATLLDVGGCRGNFTSHVVKAFPDIEGHVFDMPAMEPFFDELMGGLDLTGRVTFHGGSFFVDDLPTADVVVLGHVLHDWDEKQRAALVRKAYDAVRPGGALVVYDRMLDDDPRHVENLVISLDMLLVTEGGAEYPVSELRRHAEAAGFTSVTDQPLGDYDTFVVCRKS